MTEFVVVNEVGLRDGLQNQPKPISTSDKLLLADALFDAGIKHFEVTSFVHPKAVPQMADATEVFSAINTKSKKGTELSVLVPNVKGYVRAKESGAKSVGLVLASTDTFNKRNINMSLQQALDTCLQVIKLAKEDDIFVRTYVAGACACPYEGETPVATVHKLTAELISAGCDEISIADTIGAGGPQQIKNILTDLVSEYGAQTFNLHLHDTRGQANAMAWAGLELGIRKFDASIGGLGGCPFAPGASGNLATEDLVYLLHQSGFQTGIAWENLIDAIEVAAKITQRPLGGKIIPWFKSQNKK